MEPTNVIVIMTDELRRDCLGCYGNLHVKTPHLDGLANRGIRFDAAYTPSPICVPARAAIATGRYVHETGNWCNAMPYCGEQTSWHHQFKAAQRKMASIGKLHFRSTDDDNGFTEEILPLHIKDGKGWVHGLLRDELDIFDASEFAASIGPGDDPYTQFDREVCEATTEWLTERSGDSPGTDPWALYVSFLRPHYPLTCPEEFYNLYEPDELPPPREPNAGSGVNHPVLQHMRQTCDFDAPFDDEARRIAVASYYGLCSFVDKQVGNILDTLYATGLDKNTTIIFTSDHGECLGDRGFWTKMVMYEEAAAVPLIIAGPNVTESVCTAPVSLIDIYPTVLELGGVESSIGDDAPGHAVSFLETARTNDNQRSVISEYHDYGAQTGMFMLRRERWKLVVYPGYPSQLYDLQDDPGETCDLAQNPDSMRLIEDLYRDLQLILDPETVNRQAFSDQAQRIRELGGRNAILAMSNFDHTPVP